MTGLCHVMVKSWYSECCSLGAEPEIRESQLLVVLHHSIMERRERDNTGIGFGLIMKLFTKMWL